MKRKQHEELLQTLEQAEAQTRAIVEDSGNCMAILNRIRDSVRETKDRITAYKKAEQTPVRPKAPKPPRATKKTPETSDSPGDEGTLAAN